ncbi:DoxX family protein [Cohnella boryungensis]|uniref:DoxX family protein n=1 Tax=Cohnella boryungensis TaxID=768479 RepID=A0ABV8SKL2_9BACL
MALNRLGVSIFAVRIVVGIIFFVHGMDKFLNGMTNTSLFFEGFGIAGFLAYVISTLEVVGGAALILGLETRVFAGLFLIEMVVAIVKVKAGAGLMNGYELDLVIAACCILLAVNGSRWLSLDAVFHKKHRDAEAG